MAKIKVHAGDFLPGKGDFHAGGGFFILKTKKHALLGETIKADLIRSVEEESVVGKKINFVVEFKDDRKLFASANSKTYASIKGALLQGEWETQDPAVVPTVGDNMPAWLMMSAVFLAILGWIISSLATVSSIGLIMITLASLAGAIVTLANPNLLKVTSKWKTFLQHMFTFVLAGFFSIFILAIYSDSETAGSSPQQSAVDSSQFNQVGYLKTSKKDRIFIYEMQSYLPPSAVERFARNLMNTSERMTSAYFYPKGSNMPSDFVTLSSDVSAVVDHICDTPSYDPPRFRYMKPLFGAPDFFVDCEAQPKNDLCHCGKQ